MATNASTIKKFLGRGWTFPLQVNTSGGISLSSGEELVKQAITQILITAFGERVMLREFGSGLPDLVFEPNDDLLDRLVDADVRDALVTWERRIDVLSVTLVRDPNRSELANIILNYRLIRENRPGNLVIPFILSGESTLVS